MSTNRMDILDIFEKLAMTPILDDELDILVQLLPYEIKNTFEKNNSEKLRSLLASKLNFPDAKTVVT